MSELSQLDAAKLFLSQPRPGTDFHHLLSSATFLLWPLRCESQLCHLRSSQAGHITGNIHHYPYIFWVHTLYQSICTTTLLMQVVTLLFPTSLLNYFLIHCTHSEPSCPVTLLPSSPQNAPTPSLSVPKSSVASAHIPTGYKAGPQSSALPVTSSPSIAIPETTSRYPLASPCSLRTPASSLVQRIWQSLAFLASPHSKGFTRRPPLLHLKGRSFRSLKIF